MKIITFCSKNYENVLRLMISSWLKHYAATVYTDEKLDIDVNQVNISEGIKDWRDGTIHKIKAIKAQIESSKEDFAFLDSDCFVNDRFDEVFKENFNIGVTGDVINAGVLFFKFAPRLNSLIDEWMDSSTKSEGILSEQHSLQKMHQKYRFTVFPQSKYNCYIGFREPFCKHKEKIKWIELIKNKPKIIHFQGAGHFDRFDDLPKMIDIYLNNAKKFV